MNILSDLIEHGLYPTPPRNRSAGHSVPLAPTGLLAIAGDTRAVVSWSAPPLGEPTSYVVTSSPGGLTATVSASPATVTGLTNGVAYTFTVRGVNATGNGAVSAASNSVTPSVAPTGLSAITGLAAWFDAGQIPGPPSNGASVQTWSDVSGNGYSATQGSAGNRPTFTSSWTNSKPALAFAGGATAQFLLSTLAPLAAEGTLFVVCDLTSSTNNPGNKDQRVVSNQVTSSNDSGLNIDTFASSGNAFRVLNSGAGAVASAAITTTTPYALSLACPGFLFTNGTKTATPLNGIIKNGNPFYFGSCGVAGRQLAGHISELLYWPRVLSDSERHFVEAYLGTKFNLTMAVQ